MPQPITLTLSPRACYVLAEALENLPDAWGLPASPWQGMTEQQRDDAEHLLNILRANADRDDREDY